MKAKIQVVSLHGKLIINRLLSKHSCQEVSSGMSQEGGLHESLQVVKESIFFAQNDLDSCVPPHVCNPTACRRRSKFRFRRRSDTSKMADHLINQAYVSDKTNRFFFLNFNNQIPEPNPNPYKNRIKVKKYKKKSLTNFKNTKKARMGFEPLPIIYLKSHA